MKKYLPYIALGFAVVFFSCKKEESAKPKVSYEKNKKTKPISQQETPQIDIADLPVNMEGTNYLIHPIGNASSRVKDNDADNGSTISNYGEYQITGYLKNLKFQEIGKDTLIALTDKPVVIETATYLKDYADKSKLQLMVYTLADMDTNKDGKLDSNDIETLYISTIAGQRFTKLSTDYQELIDWEVIDAKNLLFFRTKEDTNKNGQFDENDLLQYHFVKLTDKDWKVLDYKPI